MESEKEKTQAGLEMTLTEKSAFEEVVRRKEEEIVQLQKQIQELQCSLAESEQIHAQRLINLTTRPRQETQVETERLASSQV